MPVLTMSSFRVLKNWAKSGAITREISISKGESSKTSRSARRKRPKGMRVSTIGMATGEVIIASDDLSLLQEAEETMAAAAAAAIRK